MGMLTAVVKKAASSQHLQWLLRPRLSAILRENTYMRCRQGQLHSDFPYISKQKTT